MIYFTSDPHFGHENIIKRCNRPFSTIEEMDEALVANWNRVVTNSDTIFVIGDLFFRAQQHPSEILSRLKGKKHLILGNHDSSWVNKLVRVS